MSRHAAFALAVLLALTGFACAAGAADASKESVRLVREAESVLDNWQREAANLEKARTLLGRAIELTPDYAEAYRQIARAHFRAAELLGARGKESLKRAEQALDRAIEIDPGFGNAYSLRGHLFQLQGRADEAWATLDEAERLHAADPWLPITRAELLKDQGKHAQALTLCQGVAKRHRKDARLRDSSEICTLEALQSLDRLDEAEALYKDRVKREATIGLKHGDLAYFLLCRRHQPEQAIATAEAGMQRPNSGRSRLIYFAALYHAWAQRQIAGAEKDADQLWEKLQTLKIEDPSDLMRMACGMQATRLDVLRALRDSKRAQLVPPMLAVMASAERAPKAFQATFVMEVKGGNMVGDESYINSEEDYRDPRTLVVRFPPQAVADFVAEHGETPNELLTGKTITVVGYAQKKRIDFTADGRPTGKYYFQTQITITEPWQVKEFVPADDEFEESARQIDI